MISVIKHRDLKKVKAVLFDFDGTLSTLRCGWEKVMRELMLELLGSGLEKEIDKYIDESTGIQTVHQMAWLRNKILEKSSSALGVWEYKDEYNKRLIKSIEHRTNDLKNGADPQSYMLTGTAEFLESLKKLNVKLYLASGTDHCDMSKEAELLGLSHCFDLILGAPEREASCSKEAVMRRLIEKESLCPSELAVIGDGKVEIALAVEYGAYPLGVASDELAREGINPAKRNRLINAGAAAVIGDFKERDEILGVLGIC